MDFDLSFIDVNRKQTELNDKLLHILRNNLMNKKEVCLIEHHNILFELIDNISFKEAVLLINPLRI